MGIVVCLGGFRRLRFSRSRETTKRPTLKSLCSFTDFLLSVWVPSGPGTPESLMHLVLERALLTFGKRVPTARAIHEYDSST